MADAYGFVPITKQEKQTDGTLIIEGIATDSSLDRDYQIADPVWLSKAMPEWFADGANVREQHDGKRAAGVGLTYQKLDGDKHWLRSHIVDPITVAKIEAGVLRGYSFGAKNGQVVIDKAASGGRIVGGKIFEVSVVDRPSNPSTTFTIAKADGAGDLQPVENPELVEKAEPKYSPTEFGEILKRLGKNGTLDKADIGVEHAMFGDELTKAIKQADRDAMAKTGVAMPNGDFPIPDKGHLQSAIGHLGGYTGDKAAAKKHIIKRARALKLTSMLPDDWGISKADQIIADIGALVPAAISKADGDAFDPDTEASDVDNGTSAIACIARLIISEAEGLAAGRMEEIWDIQLLVNAASSLQCFVGNETNQEAELETMSDTKADKAEGDAAGTPAATDPTVTKTDTDKTTDSSELSKTELSDLLQDAITKAVKPLQDELALVKGDMAKVLETPVAGGPARQRTTTQSAVASKADGLRREIDLCQKAIQIHGGDLQKGYRERLATAEGELSKIDG